MDIPLPNRPGFRGGYVRPLSLVQRLPVLDVRFASFLDDALSLGPLAAFSSESRNKRRPSDDGLTLHAAGTDWADPDGATRDGPGFAGDIGRRDRNRVRRGQHAAERPPQHGREEAEKGTECERVAKAVDVQP